MILKVERKSKKQEKHKNQGQTALERVRAQNISINNNLYDACNECTYDARNECTYDACSNAQKTCSIFQHLPIIDLYQEFQPKTPNF